jgi:alpha-methylacyl-CoA racemase
MRMTGRWLGGRGENHLDGGAHFHNTYRCADGKFVAIAATEPQFYRELLALCRIEDPLFSDQWNRANWPALKTRLADMFATLTRDEWCALSEGREVCLAPVRDWDETAAHPHNVERGTFFELGGITQTAPAPRFSRTPPTKPRPGAEADDARLRDWGLPEPMIATARAAGRS